MTEEQKWPDVIWIVRHGESAGNLARDAAEAAGEEIIALAVRDIDVPLSPLGERQSSALGLWYRRLPPDARPTVLLTSPYLRARETSRLLLESAGISTGNIVTHVDERLREREFGILDGLTTYGIEQKYPEQAALRACLNKFYHRPPGGESWCDVILRLRSVLDTLTRDYSGERVLIVCHQAVVFCFRYLLERMTEAEILEIDRRNALANCSVTAYACDPAAGRNGRLTLQLFNFVAPLEEAGEAVTTRPDVSIGNEQALHQ